MDGQQWAKSQNDERTLTYFSKQAKYYAQFRPDYPAELFKFVAEVAPGHALAWDCATGNGQAALGLATHFQKVIATDASQAQISQARPHPRIEYRVGPAESGGLPANSVDAVTVCQALHWIDLPRFFAEVERALVPEGVLVATVYSDPVIEHPSIDPILQRYNHAVVGTYWPPERKLVDESYRSITFPFEELPAPELVMAREWNLKELVGYLRSWSATTRYVESRGTDPTEQFESELKPLWGDPLVRWRIAWPFTIKARKKSRR